MLFTTCAHACRTLQLLSWNIDGLDERDLEERTTAVCQTVLLKQPHVILLQEVIRPTLLLLQQKLQSQYHIFTPSNPPEHYFAAILVRKDSRGSILPGSFSANTFPGTRMGRQLLELPLSFYGVDFLILTSHLESMKDYSGERKEQLRAAFDAMLRGRSEGKLCVFGGDLNVREAEVKSVRVPDGVLDAWQACGGARDTKFTWDLKENDNLDWPYPSRPQARYDRIYSTAPAGGGCGGGGGGQLRPVVFELVGQDRLYNCGRFPSDHFGLWVIYNF